MIIEPKTRGFLCTAAHPLGCAAHVEEQIAYLGGEAALPIGPKKVLVIGASTGYGLAARSVAAFGCKAATAGVFFERPGTATRTATAGWYNAAAFQRLAMEAGLHATCINGDAFSQEIKQQTAAHLQDTIGAVDLVVYSLAAPKRVHPESGKVHKSVLKPVGRSVSSRTLDTDRQEVKEVTIAPATEEEIADTISVMGGEDWELWIETLAEAGLLAEGCRTTAFTYIGERITWPLYGEATIGAAKKDLDRAAQAIGRRLAPMGGQARISVLKAVVTQASSAIPIMPLYLSLLFQVMKEQGTHEGCIQQMYRLFQQWYGQPEPAADEMGRLRCDGYELNPAVQKEVESRWSRVTTENLDQLADFPGYRKEFLKLFGFGLPGVDYTLDSEPEVGLPGLVPSL